MKSFPIGLAAALAQPAGTAPVWILRLTVGGVDYYLSDNAFAIAGWQGGVTTLAWIGKWGSIREGIASGLGEIRVSDLSVTCVIDPDASPNMEDLALATDLESSPVSLYLWCHGLDADTDPPAEMLRGYVQDVEISDDTSVALTIEDETSRLQHYIGNKVDLATYPSADPDDVGRVIPIVYGSVRKLPTLAVDAGIKTSLPVTITDVATAVQVSDAAGLAIGMTLQVDEERVSIDSIAGDILTVTRGVDATTAVSHLKGAAIWQIKGEFIFLAADHPVNSLPKIYGTVGEAEVDITAIATRYTGQPGDEHVSYPGRAVVSLPGYITVTQAVDLLVEDGLSLDDATELVDSIAIDDGISVADTIAISDGISVADSGHQHEAETSLVSVQPDSIEGAAGLFFSQPKGNAIDGDTNTAAILNNRTGYGDATVTRLANFTYSGTPISYRWYIYYGDATYPKGLKVNGVYTLPDSTIKTIWYSSWQNLTSWSYVAGMSIAFGCNGTAGQQSRVWEVGIEIKYYPTGIGVGFAAANISKSGTVSKSGSANKSGTVSKFGTVSKSGTVSLTGVVTLRGNSVANTLVGDRVLVDVERYTSAPADVIADILASYCGVASCAQAGSLPPAYRIDGAITEYRRAIDWLDAIAFQCRCYFRMFLGAGVLIARPDTPAPVKTIPACRIDDGGNRQLRRSKAAMSEVINTIALLYDRDWTQSSGDSAYRASVPVVDLDSVDDYGEREQPEMFRCDWIRDPDMAASVAAFYLAAYARRYWIHEFEVFLDHSELALADAVTIGFLGNLTAEIVEAGFAPGDIETMDTITLIAHQY